MVKQHFLALIILCICSHTRAQVQDSTANQSAVLDSLYIAETEQARGKPKVLHAEPLFVDLIRDLGARKGESEWNIGTGIADHSNHQYYSALVEYEFAPVDRLGLEIELPFSFYLPSDSMIKKGDLPDDKLDGIKLAAQYSFYVNEKGRISMALGYINELQSAGFKRIKKGGAYSGNVYNPFFIAAKRWGRNWHTLLYTGPRVEQHLGKAQLEKSWHVNGNVHYMISGTRNFVGLECNSIIASGKSNTILRPQMRVELADNLLVGVVTGIPLHKEIQRMSVFIRFIYEPGHRRQKPLIGIHR